MDFSLILYVAIDPIMQHQQQKTLGNPTKISPRVYYVQSSQPTMFLTKFFDIVPIGVCGDTA